MYRKYLTEEYDLVRINFTATVWKQVWQDGENF